MNLTIIDQNGKNAGTKNVEADLINQQIFSVTIDGQQYTTTGKTGTNNKTGAPVTELATDEDARLWIDDAKTTIWMD